ncbi:MAG TPA: aminopeptidase [Caldilineaceae bacterium]|nr:aminopeptidase [Caldilineaceae bacterium]
MADIRTERLAELLVTYCTDVRPHDWVLVRGSIETLPLLEEVVKRVAIAGGNPTIQLETNALQETFLHHASAEQLSWVAPYDEMMAEQLDVRIVIQGSDNTRTFTNVDPQRLRLYQQARRQHQATYMRRSAEGTHRWVGTLFPCPAYAQEADMSLREYEDFVYSATYADQADPVACWRQIHDTQQRLIDWLAGKDQVIVRGPNVDLTLSIKDRFWINSDGKRNMPSGEIFTGPVEESVNGWVRYSYPAIRDGLAVEGVEFEIKDGKVVNARAAKNEAYLHSQLDADAGARYFGEFAVGTNYQIQRFTKNILYDEKIGGTMHMAIGAGYPETGSNNKSIVHWDFICDMRQDSEILVDGELFYKNGQFQI